MTAALLAVLAASLPGDAPPAPRGGAPLPLARAHAHNDYRHPRPLLDALERGFTSVEADIYLVEGKLLVGHARAELRPERTLEALYLDPLLRRVRAGGGRVFPGGGGFTLLIDVKTEAGPTWAALERVLERFAEMLTVYRGRTVQPGAVTAIVSGERARADMEAMPVRYAGLDGRLEDLDSDAPASLIPLISDSWARRFRWDGLGPLPEAERADLRRIVERAHAAGRRIRLWAAPDRKEAWEALYRAGVDLINTDDLDGLAAFLHQKATARRV